MEIKKLSKKIFYTLVLILTISILSVVSIFNIQNYLEQKNSINNSLNVSLNKRDRKIPPAKIKERNDIDNVENRNIK